jgi:opacity protein-like surface antigen
MIRSDRQWLGGCLVAVMCLPGGADAQTVRRSVGSPTQAESDRRVHSSKAQEPPAPEWQYKVEVFGNVANGRFYWGDQLWGSGVDYGVGAGVRPFSGGFHRLGFEVQAAQLKDSGSFGSTQAPYRFSATSVMVNVLYHFRNGAEFQPFVFGGLGQVRADYAYQCVDCVFDPDPVTGKLVSRGVEEIRAKGTNAGVTYGAGLKIAVHPHLSIRSELLVVNTTPGSGWNWGWVRLQTGLGAHF